MHIITNSGYLLLFAWNMVWTYGTKENKNTNKKTFKKVETFNSQIGRKIGIKSFMFQTILF